MPTLVSMKLDKKAMKERATPMSGEDGPVYPWGLAVTLDDESLSALDLSSLPKVGATLMLLAKVDVTSSSENKTGDGVRRSLSLQITDLALDAADKKDPRDVLYTKKGSAD